MKEKSPELEFLYSDLYDKFKFACADRDRASKSGNFNDYYYFAGIADERWRLINQIWELMNHGKKEIE